MGEQVLESAGAGGDHRHGIPLSQRTVSYELSYIDAGNQA